MKKIVALLMTIFMAVTMVACGNNQVELEPEEPEVAQMKAICELAVMDCYYHNVAKFKHEDADGVLWWKKDKHFWIEYSGVVKLGIDVSLVEIEVNDTTVYITLPEAKILGCKVDENKIDKDSYIVAKKSADIEAADEIEAIKAAQAEMERQASSDTVLLANAQQRAQSLLEEYIKNIGVATGKEYTIKWEYAKFSGGGADISATEDVVYEESPNT